MPIDHVYLRRLRMLGIVEGCSTLLLFFVAMPLKYAADLPIAVTIVGSIHGLLFVALVAALAIGRDRVPLPSRLVGLGIVAAVVPFGPFLVDGRLARLGQARGDDVRGEAVTAREPAGS